MTKPLPFTRASVRRAIAAARDAGMEVGGFSVHPDGTVTVHKVAPGQVAADGQPEQDGPNAWGNFQA